MENEKFKKLANLRMLTFVATKLGDLCKDVVFLGGCTTALFITDLAAPDARYTLDVDCIIDVISLYQYHQLEQKLITRGFKKFIQDDVICRWHYDDVILDIMPTDEKILGFSNRWYKEAILHAHNFLLDEELTIKLVTSPYFLATKLEAFKNRGKMDFFISHDFEDIVSIIDGRLEIVDEIMQSDKLLKKYLIKLFSDFDKNRHFHDALPGHFIQYGNLANERIEMFLQKMRMFSNMDEK